jgi:lipopolysaccharide/colanic/teichoic acid biosynthesis glycosyltransferase
MLADIEGGTTLSRVDLVGALRDTNRRPYYAMKRLIDILLASLALLLFVPLLLVIAIAIKLDSPGPVIFKQQRLRGRRIVTNGQSTWVVTPFTLYKFRTMVADSDPAPHRAYMAAYISGDEEHFASSRVGRKPGDSYRPVNDPRLTRVGTMLRKVSIDEFPQLWNVLRGDMSLVGPRPPMPYEAELYEERHFQRLAAPCGLTGWAQVRGRCTVGFEEMVRLDLEYIARRSVWFDLWVLLLTVPVVASTKGAG